MKDNYHRPLLETSETNHEDEVAAKSNRKPLVLVGLSILFVVAISTASYFSYGAGYRKSLNNNSVGIDVFAASDLKAEEDTEESGGRCSLEGDRCRNFGLGRLPMPCCDDMVCRYNWTKWTSTCMKKKSPPQPLCYKEMQRCTLDGPDIAQCCDGLVCDYVQKSMLTACQKKE